MRTSRRKILEMIKGEGMTEWEKEILLRPFISDQEKIIALHTHLEKRMTDHIEDEDTEMFSDDSEIDFYNTLELAIQRDFDLLDLYEPRS